MRSKSPAPQATPDDDEFLLAVRYGLRQRQRAIPPKFFYDARGSQLFDLICTTAEYYLSRIETGILNEFGAQMAELIGKSCVLIELGSGSATKTPLLLRHLADDAMYMPIDICESQLLQSTQRLKTMFPAMHMQSLRADYTRLPSLSLDDFASRRRVNFFPGSTIGNSTPDEAVQLLRHVAQLVGSNGALLIGVDCKKSPDLLNAAYNDASGYTAAFISICWCVCSVNSVRNSIWTALLTTLFTTRHWDASKCTWSVSADRSFGWEANLSSLKKAKPSTPRTPTNIPRRNFNNWHGNRVGIRKCCGLTATACSTYTI
jgi:hypothetical protein